MSEPIKQTLFRFSSVRTPELITEESKQNFFVSHPDSSSGPFFAVLAALGPGDDKRQELLDAAASFTEYTTVATVKAINPVLYEFSQWLIINRETLTVTSTNAEITSSGVLELTAPQRLALWDNLFYQVLVSSSGYIQDAIMELLVADHFLDIKATVTSEDDTYRRLAQSTLVLPKEMFSSNVANSTEAQIGISNTTKINKTALVQSMNAAKASVNAKLIDQAKKEIETYQQAYYAQYASDYFEARNTYETAYATWAASATTATVTDQFTGYTAVQYTVNDSPSLSFSPAAQVDAVAIAGAVSGSAVYVLESNNLFAQGTLGGVITGLTIAGANQTQNAFDSTSFSNKAAEIGGTVFHAPGPNTTGVAYSYYLHVLKRAPDNYCLLMVMYLDRSGVSVNSAEVTVGAPLNQTSYTHTVAADGRMLFIDFTPADGFGILDSDTEIQVTGTIELLGGITLTWDVMLNMQSGTFGIMDSEILTGQGSNIYIPSGFGIRRVGISDYKMVEQSLCGYRPGEVSHIENILAREYKEKSTRRLRRSEETNTTTSETERENLTDTVSTSRYELQSEIADILRKESSSSVNSSLSATAPTGPVTITASLGADFAQNTSKENSKNESSKFAQDITRKATEKIVSKIKEERIIKIIEEFEEQNKHGFDNRLGTQHISGVYRWVDKEYKNELKNYGKRLIYEFMIPEPARLHYEVKSSDAQKIIEEPLDPRKKEVVGIGKLENSSKINEYNYQSWAAVYNAEVTPPPPLKLMVGQSFSKSQQQGDGNWDKNKAITENISIPDGYGLDKAFVSISMSKNSSHAYISIGIADSMTKYSEDEKNVLFIQDTSQLELDKYSEAVPVSVYFSHIWGGFVNVSLELLRKKETYEAWQLETFNSILNAYELKLGKYKDELAQAEVKRGNILAVNPAYYREIEQTLIKKNCIEYMVGHKNMGKKNLSGSGFTGTFVNNTAEMDRYASSIKFFEQAFEWSIMSYSFYPFYWADKNNWVEMYGYDNDDPLFRDFMRAGMARVMITVRPGFEKAVMHYLETGQIWYGNHEPVIGDDLYVSIIDELKVIDTQVEDTWFTRLPSTLTLVQSGTVSLQATGLPNWCGTTPPDENILPETEAQMGIYIEGYTPPLV